MGVHDGVGCFSGDGNSWRQQRRFEDFITNIQTKELKQPDGFPHFPAGQRRASR
jgi:hypothetical protein